MNNSEPVANFIMYLFYVRIPASHFAGPRLHCRFFLYTFHVTLLSFLLCQPQSVRLFTFPFRKVSQQIEKHKKTCEHFSFIYTKTECNFYEFCHSKSATRKSIECSTCSIRHLWAWIIHRLIHSSTMLHHSHFISTFLFMWSHRVKNLFFEHSTNQQNRFNFHSFAHTEKSCNFTTFWEFVDESKLHKSKLIC